MGGHRNKTVTTPDYTGIQLQTSAMSQPVPLAWGKARGSPNLIDYTDYQVHKKKVGKGGALGKGATETTYSATIVLGLCEGPITGISKTYINQGFQNGLTSSGFTLFTGTTPQSPWSYMVTNHPDHAQPYQGICYLAAANYDLGMSDAIPNLSFEVEAPLYNTGYTGGGDADCALLVQDFLTNAQYGVGFPTARLGTTSLLSGPDATTTGDSAYQTYCRAMSWGLSLFIQNQEPASSILARLLQITNTAPVTTGYSLEFVPWGDETVTGNGVTYLPPTASAFDFTDDDYYQEEGSTDDPVQVNIRDPFDAYNRVAIECAVRDYDYNPVPIDYVDQTQSDPSVNPLGPRQASRIAAHEICETAMATQVVSLIAARMLYIRSSYTFKLRGPQYIMRLPMEVGTITDTKAGLDAQPVRIVAIDEDEDGILTFTCEEFPGTVGAPTTNAGTAVTANPTNSQVTPDPVNTPVLFEPNSLAAQFLTGSSAPTIIAAVSGGAAGVADPNWGGANVFVSTDGTTYAFIGRIDGPASMGTLTANLASFGGANPDATDTLSVSLAESAGTLASASSGATAAAGATLAVVQDGLGGAIELVGPETATLTGTHAYNLTNLYRGLFGTTAGSHTTGALFARLDNAIFSYQLPAAYIGVALHFKFQSFNIWGQAVEDLSTCTVYTYTPAGTGFGGGSGGVPTAPTGVTATGGISSALVSWAANPVTDNVETYELWRALGPAGSSGSATKIWSGNALNYNDTGLLAAVTYTYFVKAVNAVGASAFSSGADATTSAASSGSGITAVIAVASAVSAGDFVNVFDNSGTQGVRKADATDPAKYANGFVKASAASGTVLVYFNGLNDAVSPTDKAKVWLSETVPGGWQNTVPAASSTGHIDQAIGTAIPGAGIAFAPETPIPL